MCLFFYGVTFSICAKLGDDGDREKIAEACQQSGFAITDEWELARIISRGGRNHCSTF